MLVDWTQGAKDQQPITLAEGVWTYVCTPAAAPVVAATGVGEVEFYRRVVDEERE